MFVVLRCFEMDTRRVEGGTASSDGYNGVPQGDLRPIRSCQYVGRGKAASRLTMHGAKMSAQPQLVTRAAVQHTRLETHERLAALATTRDWRLKASPMLNVRRVIVGFDAGRTMVALYMTLPQRTRLLFPDQFLVVAVHQQSKGAKISHARLEAGMREDRNPASMTKQNMVFKHNVHDFMCCQLLLRPKQGCHVMIRLVSVDCGMNGVLVSLPRTRGSGLRIPS